MRSELNHLYFDEKVTGSPLPATAALYNLVNKQGYQDIILDLRRCKKISAEVMLPFATMCRSYRKQKIDFEILLPEIKSVSNFLINTNWAHLIKPEKYESTTLRNIQHVAALQFMNSDEHHKVVDSSINLILSVVPGIDRRRIKALEWALNEITGPSQV